MLSLLPERATEGETRPEDGADGGSPLWFAVLGVLAGLATAAFVGIWYRSVHSPGGYVTWSRREETTAPASLVYIWRRANTDDISPPF